MEAKADIEHQVFLGAVPQGKLCQSCLQPALKRVQQVHEAQQHQKETYIVAKKRIKDSIHRYMISSETTQTISISKGIIEVIIGEMFFKLSQGMNNEETEPITKTNALCCSTSSRIVCTWRRLISWSYMIWYCSTHLSACSLRRRWL